MNANFQFDFEKLTVYQFALDFIDEIFEIYKKLPQEYKYSLGNNLIRAGLSVANNLQKEAERYRKKKKEDIMGFPPIQPENAYLFLMFSKDKN